MGYERDGTWQTITRIQYNVKRLEFFLKSRLARRIFGGRSGLIKRTRLGTHYVSVTGCLCIYENIIVRGLDNSIRALIKYTHFI
jgi:hypothetical protein